MLKRCLECRSDAVMDVSEPLESSGALEQTVSIRCTGEKKSNCPVGVALSFDANLTSSEGIEAAVSAMWNSLGN